jgi:hypothetical protein
MTCFCGNRGRCAALYVHKRVNETICIVFLAQNEANRVAVGVTIGGIDFRPSQSVVAGWDASRCPADGPWCVLRRGRYPPSPWCGERRARLRLNPLQRLSFVNI